MNINRKYPFPRAENISFNLPYIEILDTSGKINTLFVRNTKLPIIKLRLIINSGSLSDGIGKKGTAFSTSMLIDEGAGGLDALQIDSEFEFLGSNFSITSDHDYIIVSLLALKENFERSFEIVSRIIKHPHLNDSDFERVKNEQLNRIKQNHKDPSYIASSFFERQVFDHTGYAFPSIGLIEDVDNIQRIDAENYYNNYFLSANADMIVVGDCERDYIEKLILKYLGDWKTGDRKIKHDDKFTGSKTGIFLINKKGAVQSELRIGHLSGRRTAPDYFAKTVMNTILGGQFSSRINKNLREDKGFTYGAHSSFNYNRDAGIFSVSTAVNIEHTVRALSEIYTELSNIRIDISREEIDFAKKYLTRRYPLLFETYGQLARHLTSKIFHGLPDDYFNNYLEAVNQLEESEVLKAARENIDTERLVTVIVGDGERILPELRKFSGAEINLTEIGDAELIR